MPNGFMYPGGGVKQITLRAKGESGTAVQATLGSAVRGGTVGADGFADIRLPRLGAWTVRTSKGAYSFTQTVNVYQYGITECWALVDKPFADCTPGEIQAIARTGLASKVWALKDEHAIQLETGESITVVIAGFDHDTREDGEGTLPLTLVMKDCFKTKYAMNATATNVGGWEKMTIRTLTFPSLKEQFPPEWQQIMAKCQKRSDNGGPNYNISVTTIDDLFLLSEAELFGASRYGVDVGTQYPIFPDNASRIKKCNGVVDSWMTRTSSNQSGTSNYGTVVYTDGARLVNIGSAQPGAVAAGFCVG